VCLLLALCFARETRRAFHLAAISRVARTAIWYVAEEQCCAGSKPASAAIPLSGRSLAALAFCSRQAGSAAVSDLVRRRILLCVEAPRGRRAGRYRVNPAPHRWRCGFRRPDPWEADLLPAGEES